VEKGIEKVIEKGIGTGGKTAINMFNGETDSNKIHYTGLSTEQIIESRCTHMQENLQ
jgi:hypothetical protein